jgi:hypothetical protein
MIQTFSGGCACGSIRFEANATPLAMLNCHCRDCQRATGSAYGSFVVVPNDTVRITGEPRYHRTVGNGGKAVERGFCPNCGSQVTAKLERLPDALALQAGSLDQPSLYRPTLDIFTDSAQPWDAMRAETQKLPGGLPA